MENVCCTSIIVACELRDGVAKKQSAKLAFNAEQVLNCLPILALEASFDEVYAAIRVNLEKRGLIIGQHDLLIAANEREFRRVENLTVESRLYV